MPRTSSWTELNRSIHRGCDPYAGFDAGRRTADHQGWHSDHPFLRETLAALRPSVVVEVGVWKGASSITMAETMRDRAIDGAVLAVDTWLGSWEHYEHETFFADLHIQNGYPTLYNTFITNVLDKGVSDFILPLALDSANAAFVVKRRGIVPDVVHIDAGHDRKAVRNDLDLWWEVLRPGGALICDDYDKTGDIWPSVRDAVDEFLAETPNVDFEAVPFKARFTKPVI